MRPYNAGSGTDMIRKRGFETVVLGGNCGDCGMVEVVGMVEMVGMWKLWNCGHGGHVGNCVSGEHGGSSENCQMVIIEPSFCVSGSYRMSH